MARSTLFGASPVGTISVVDPPVSQWYARKARITFLAVSIATGVLVSGALVAVGRPVLAVLVGVLTGLVFGFVAALVVKVWPVLRVLWHWAAEIVAGCGVAALVSVTARSSRPLLTAALVLAPVVAVVAAGPVRRWVWSWVWCAAVRHRLRLSFADVIRAASRTRPGCAPLILLARPTPAGARVWVWLRPGLELADLEDRTGKLAVACWADDARVVRASSRYAALIRVDLTRRDPLTVKVPSPLPGLLPRKANDDGDSVPTSPGMPPVGLDLADIPEPEPEPRNGRR